MRRILVTGAGGFIGRHCRHLLKSADDAELHAIGYTSRDDKGVRWHVADLRDPIQAAAVAAAARPTHLLHGAWVATPGDPAIPYRWESENR